MFLGYAHIVAGDLNVGHTQDKNGTDLYSDCISSCMAGEDRYDETHALLRDGLVAGLTMINLTATIPDTTFPSIPGSPIDNIYVTGDLEQNFQPATKASDTFGSDHLAVIAVANLP